MKRFLFFMICSSVFFAGCASSEPFDPYVDNRSAFTRFWDAFIDSAAQSSLGWAAIRAIRPTRAVYEERWMKEQRKKYYILMIKRGFDDDITNNVSSSKRNVILDDDNFSTDHSFGTIRENAYGLGVHSDQFGRPVRYEVPNWPKNEPTEFLKVKPDAYGPGIGQDQFGRPVRTGPGW